MNDNKIIKIQACWRGYSQRKNNLPNSILLIKNIIKNAKYECDNTLKDGRTNSSIDEKNIINILIIDKRLKNRLYIPATRHWFDIAVLDYQYGYLPINIKTTTTMTADNTGNLAMCVYALTNEKLNIKSTYNNGSMSKILINKLKKDELNNELKKDYYFIVVDKKNKDIIIANSFKGLSKLTPNINNLPFQIKWKDNQKFIYKNINDIKKIFINTIRKPKPSWQEYFLSEIRSIK